MRRDPVEAFLPCGAPPASSHHPKRTGAIAPMTLPAIAEAIPAAYSLGQSNDAMWQYFALGAATNWSLPAALVRKALQGKLTPYELAMKAASHAIETKCSKLDYMHVAVLIADSYEGAFDYNCYALDGFLKEFKVDPDRPHIFIGTQNASSYGNYVIQVMEPVFHQLKSDVERSLFYRALRMIEHSRFRFAPIGTPALSLHKVRVQHWDHNWDEVGYFRDLWDRFKYEDREECIPEEGKFEDAYAPEYSFNKLKAKLGPLMFAPRGSKKLRNQDILNLCQSPSETVSKIARAVLACTEVFKRNKAETIPSLEYSDHDLIEEASILRWNERDDVVKIYDDYANHTTQMGGCVTNVFGIAAYQCDSFENAMRVVRAIDAMCDELVAVNNLIGAISVPEQ